MKTKHILAAAGILAAAAVFFVPHTRDARADDQPSHGAADEGLHLFKVANCVGCHHWDGQGGGGYGGRAANLRLTQLDRDQIMQVVNCGRPGTSMPHFDQDAYTDGRCYGMKESDMTADTKVAAPTRWLRPPDVAKVTDYVLANLKGHGAPTYAECEAFFGGTSRVCETYPHPGAAAGGSGHMKVESAPDANAK